MSGNQITPKMADEEEIYDVTKAPDAVSSLENEEQAVEKSSEGDTELSEEEISADSSKQDASEEQEDHKLPTELPDDVLDLQENDPVPESMPNEGSSERKQNLPLPCDSCEFPDPYTVADNTFCWGLCSFQKGVRDVSEFWLISVPADPTCQGAWEKLNTATNAKSLSQNYKFHIPKLKVGTLDQLVGLTDHLNLLDNYVESVTRKLAVYIKEESTTVDHAETIKMPDDDFDPATYLTRFTWNAAKYPIRLSLPCIADILTKEVNKVEENMKQKSVAYEKIKSSLRCYEMRHTESLQFRYLGDIVKKEHFVINSKYLTTLLVVVPNRMKNLWLKMYENLAEMVVPMSSMSLFNDGNHTLFNVTLYKKCVKEFKENALKNKFIIRDFEFSEQKLKSELTLYEKLRKIKCSHLCVLLRWAQANFRECFAGWIHVKALRVFVESVLRYGLPVNFQAALLLPLKHRKLREALNKLYSNLDTSFSGALVEEIPGGLAAYAIEEYYPYVHYKLSINMTDDGSKNTNEH